MNNINNSPKKKKIKEIISNNRYGQNLISNDNINPNINKVNKRNKSVKNKNINNKQLTYFSNEIISKAVNNKESENKNKKNNEDDFILNFQNNLSNSKKSLDLEFPNTLFQSKIKNMNKPGDKNENLKRNQFLKREELFQKKLLYNRQKIMNIINDEILSNMKQNKIMNEKSKRLLEKRNKRNKNLYSEDKDTNLKNKRNLIINSEENNSNSNNNNIYNNNLKKYSTRNNSESNIKLKKANSESHLHKYKSLIKKSKSSKLLFMDRRKETPNYDEIMKYNNRISPSLKLKKIEIKKINDELNNLLTEEIDFYFFCECLFKLGFVNIYHQKENIINYNDIEQNDEIIDNLLIRENFNIKLITKEYIFNEINIIKKAFKSIHEDFQFQKYEIINPENQTDINSILSNINYNISREDFKLFVFCLLNIFEGYNEEEIKEEEKNNDKLVIYDLIQKIIYIKNLKKFTPKFINDYRNYFSYMIKTRKKFEMYFYIQKKEKIQNQKAEYYMKDLSFSPKLYKPKKTSFLTKNDKIKNKNIKENNLPKECTFKPKISDDSAIEHIKAIKLKYQIKEKNDKNNNNINNIKENNKISDDKSKNISEEPTFTPKINKNYNKKMFTNRDVYYKSNRDKKKDEIIEKLKNEEIRLEKKYGHSEEKNKKIKIKKEKEKEVFKNNNANKRISSNKKKDNINYDIGFTDRIRNNNFIKYKPPFFLNIRFNEQSYKLIIEKIEDYEASIHEFCLINNFDTNKYIEIKNYVKNKLDLI